MVHYDPNSNALAGIFNVGPSDAPFYDVRGPSRIAAMRLYGTCHKEINYAKLTENKIMGRENASPVSSMPRQHYIDGQWYAK